MRPLTRTFVRPSVRFVVVPSSLSSSSSTLTISIPYLHRSFAASTGGKGTSNDADDDDDTTAISLSRGGWYSPSSIERRLSVKRKAPPVDPQGQMIKRTVPGLSDEDIYLQAGAPGYEIDRSNPGVPVKSSVPSFPSSSPSMPPSPSSSVTSPLSTLMHQASTGKGTLVRVSQTKISKRSLSTFLQMYNLRILPMYKGIPGILSVRLYIEDPSLSLTSSPSSSSSASPSSSSTSASDELHNDKAHVHIQSITEWTTYDSMMEETIHNPSNEYTECMKQLSTYFRDIPTTYLMTQAVNHDLRYLTNGSSSSSEKNSSTEKDASSRTKSNDHSPGPELGLR